MTVIAAATDGHTVWMAADSQTTNADGRSWRSDKITAIPVGRTGSALFGACGDFRLAVIARRLVSPIDPDPTDDADLDGWAQAIAEAFTDLALDSNSPIRHEDGDVDGYALLGYAGRLWVVFTNSTLAIRDPATAIGSGGDLATGALEVLTDGRPPTGDDVVRAVAASIRHHADCSGPIRLRQVEHPNAARVDLPGAR